MPLVQMKKFQTKDFDFAMRSLTVNGVESWEKSSRSKLERTHILKPMSISFKPFNVLCCVALPNTLGSVDIIMITNNKHSMDENNKLCSISECAVRN